LFVVSGPSGVGKGTVVRVVRAMRPDLVYSVSATTRAPRPGEHDGVQYRFLTPDLFAELIERGALLEWADVFGHRYGTPAAPIAEAIAAGRDVIVEIDVQGAAQIRSGSPDAVSIFLIPPSRAELERRLRHRGTESETDLRRRLADADGEMEQAGWFDHVVVNDDVKRAARDVADIIERSH
jgi:guanylate kinase